MAIMLIGRWSDDDRTLTITDSQWVADSDQAAIDALFKEAQEAEGADWGYTFDEDHHYKAVQRAYEECARDFGAVIEDEVEGCTPVT